MVTTQVQPGISYIDKKKPGQAITNPVGQLTNMGKGMGSAVTTPVGQLENTKAGGAAVTSPVAPNENTGVTSDGGFNIPTNVYPESSSGIDWNNPFVKQMMGGLMGSLPGNSYSGTSDAIAKQIGNLPQYADEYGSTLQNKYKSMMQDALGPQAFQGTMNNLAAKGMLNSSVAGNAMAKTASDITKEVGDKYWDSAVAGLNAQMNVPGQMASAYGAGTQADSVMPNTYANLLSLGNKSENTNKLAPYELMANMLLGL